MKRLTLMVAAMLATLLVLRPPLFAQNEAGNPDMGAAANDPGQDNGPDNGDQQVAPDQAAGGGDEAADQNNDPNAAPDQANQNDPSDQNGQNDQGDQNDNNQADTGAGDDANTVNQ